MSSKEIRQLYLDFMKEKGHVIVPSASLIPDNDPTTLFTSAGMQQMIPYLSGEKHSLGNKIADSQKCFRSQDIEEVGDNRHTTFFEMLGNWSFGDYFKEKQIPWLFEFLTQKVGLDPKKLLVTVYRGNKEINTLRDDESVRLWKEAFASVGIDAKDVDFAEENGMQDGKIFYYPDKKNWWSRSGTPDKMPVGELGGPDSEVFWDFGEDLKLHENSEFKDLPCHVNCDCGRFLEIGNSVFMEFIRTANGFEYLPQKNVDFGGGLERIVAVSENKQDVFETDLFELIIKKVEELSEKTYQENKKEFRIISDHIKAATFIIADDKGTVPSNSGQGYLVRRLIRRAIRYGRQLGITKEYWLKDIAEEVKNIYGDIYSELVKNYQFVCSELDKEEERFEKTLEKGLKEFEKRDIFDLYQTYGFPLEMTFEEMDRRGIKYDRKELEEDFNKKLQEHQELSRTASAGMFKGGLADASEVTIKYHTATHLLLASLRQLFGNDIFQKGSNITAERMRFDFSYPQKLTPEQIEQIEQLVNEKIRLNLPVEMEEMSFEDAKKINAMGVFENKYGDRVKVYSIGDKGDYFSVEICGGPHVKNTGELGNFKIAKEEAVSNGVRRIKAILE